MGTWVYVTADELNVRSGPGTNYTAIDSLSYQKGFDAKDYSNGFYYIRYTDSVWSHEQKYDWVSADYIHLYW